MKTLILLISLALFMACAGTETPVYTPQTYSIEQFYQNTRIGGGAFS